MANRAFKIIGIVLLSVFGLIVIAIGAIYLVSGNHLKRVYAITPPPLAISADSATIARGRHLATVRLGCTECHGPDLAGKIAVDAMPFGKFVATNLTAGTGGVGKTYSDVDFIRAIRSGVRPDGKPLVFMPSNAYAPLSGEDIAAVVAYVRSVPAVDKELPPSVVGPVARMLIATGAAPLVPAEVVDHSAPYPAAIPPGATAEYGGYLVATGACQECHGADLTGGKIAGGPDAPPARNITPAGIGNWSEADFLRAFREGKRPDGTPIHPFMPWQSMGKMTDEELLAIYQYLKTVPAKETAAG